MLLALFLAMACAAPGWAADGPPALPALPGQGPGQDAMPPVEIRVIRDIQNRAYGAPSLPTDAAKPEALLALSDLGSMAASSDPGNAKLQQEDYDALFALLQRYRDDLLKMGMDAAELQSQMESLTSRTTELEHRLDVLQPRDGLKVFGRFYSVFDDLHLIGPAALTAINYLGTTDVISGAQAPVAKPAGVGVRMQVGLAHAELMFQGTRGPVSASAEIDLLTLWGYNVAAIGLRHIDLEWRTPVVLQFGDLSGALTPLTLWRNDQYQPFEPLIFRDRRQRLEDDLHLKPNEWPLTGLRASTDMRLFGSTLLHVESITGVAAYAITSNKSPFFNSNFVYSEPQVIAKVVNYQAIGNTYFEAWKLDLPLGAAHAWSVGYNGTFFWDETASEPGLGIYMPMHELVNSLALNYKEGGLSAGLEAAMSSYQNPWLTGTAQSKMPALSGTAVVADADWSGEKGHVHVFGRYVSSGFHAAAAQGRTVDYNYQISPFLTENSQIGTLGLVGLIGGIPESYASRLNDVLIPAGMVVSGGGGIYNVSNQWRNLIAYGPGEEIDPYGAATPNRAGAGLDGSWKFFNGLLVPQASAEFFQEMDPVSATTGAQLKAFAQTRYRAGLDLDLEPWLKWPLRFGGGITLTNASDGQTDALGNSYTLTSSLTDFSVDWNAGKPWGVGLGYRNMTAQGQDEAFVFPSGQAQTWDTMGAGIWWRPTDNVSLDINYSQGHSTPLGQKPNSLQIDQGVARLTLEF